MCAVYIAVVRIAQCEICTEQWTLEPGERPPDKCVHCGSGDWMWGVESRDSRFVRQQITRERRSLNKGVKSRKRQEQGRKQWRRFQPKPEEGEKE